MRIPSEVLNRMDEEELREYSSMIDHSSKQAWEMVYLLKEITRMLEDLRNMEKGFAEQRQLAGDTNLEIRDFENKIMKKYAEFMPVSNKGTRIPNFKGGALGDNTCQ